MHHLCIFSTNIVITRCTLAFHLCCLLGASARETLIAHQAKGVGYALSTTEELKTVQVKGEGLSVQQQVA